MMWSDGVGDVSEADGSLIGRSGSRGHQNIVYSVRERLSTGESG